MSLVFFNPSSHRYSPVKLCMEQAILILKTVSISSTIIFWKFIVCKFHINTYQFSSKSMKFNKISFYPTTTTHK